MWDIKTLKELSFCACNAFEVQCNNRCYKDAYDNTAVLVMMAMLVMIVVLVMMVKTIYNDE